MPITFDNNPSRPALPGPNAGWDCYVNAVKQQDQWWRRHHRSPSLSVLGVAKSYRRTISVLSEVIRRDWNNLKPRDQERLLGLTPEAEGWPLLGRMRPMARGLVFDCDQDRRKIEAAVRTVAEATDDDHAFPTVVIKAYREICSIHRVGTGTASRLLTLARPDRCVSVNGGSREKLAEEFGLCESTLDEERNYEELLRKVYQRRWFKAPKPTDLSRKIWTMRAALIDCFVYRPKPPNDKHWA